MIRTYLLSSNQSIDINYSLKLPSDEEGVNSVDNVAVLHKGDCLKIKDGIIRDIAFANPETNELQFLSDHLNVFNLHFDSSVSISKLVSEKQLREVNEEAFNKLAQEQHEKLVLQMKALKQQLYISLIEEAQRNVSVEDAKSELLSCKGFYERDDIVYCETVPSVCILFSTEPILYILDHIDPIQMHSYDFYSQDAKDALQTIRESGDLDVTLDISEVSIEDAYYNECNNEMMIGL